MDWLSFGASLVKLGAPMIASVFLGPEAGPLAGALVGKLAEKFGCPATPEAVQTAIAADPDAASKVQAVEQAHADIITAYLADMQNARAMTVDLGKTGSIMQYGAAVVSVVILLAYGVICSAIMLGRMVESNLSLAAYGSLSAFAGTVVAFWLGSTKQSADKTDAVVSMARTVAPVVAKRK